MLRKSAAAAVRRLISGSEDGLTDYVREMTAPGDAGLFGPQSVTWTVLSNTATLMAGIRSLILQSLDPLTVTGVARHSRFRSEPIGRLQMTARFVTIAAFGTTNQIERECATIRGLHERVKGTTPDGRQYSASDPAQLRFVHIALIDSFLSSYQNFAANPLTDEDADRFVAEWNAVAPLLGFESLDLPTDQKQLSVMLADYGKGFQVGAEAVEALKFISSPPLPAAMKPFYGLMLTGAAGTLPRYARRMLPRTIPSPGPLTTKIAGTLSVRVSGEILGISPAYQAALARVTGQKK